MSLRCFRPSATRRGKAVLVAGARTPFCKSFGELTKCDQIALGVSCVNGLLQKTKLPPKEVDQLIWGNVVLTVAAPNVSREIIIDLNLPRQIVGHSISMACASGLKAVVEAHTLINDDQADVIIAGGSDSLTNAQLALPRGITNALGSLVMGPKVKGATGNPFLNKFLNKKWRKAFFKTAGPFGRWFPEQPAIAERSTGKTMGYHADMICELNNVPRDEQDDFAARSHTNAIAARNKGYLAEEITPITVSSDMPPVTADNLMAEPNRAKMSTLKAAFRKAAPKATITAANSSALTDGGAACLMMSESYAQKNGYPTDVWVKSWSHAAIDPYPSLLLAPAIAIPKALKKAGLELKDIDVFEIHEAFAGQVLATIKVLNEDKFCNEFLGRPALGKIPMEKVNVNGGSLALGHPFAATGGRVVTAAMNELRRSGKRYALISICAAGGLGTVAILEHQPQAAPAKPAAAAVPSGAAAAAAAKAAEAPKQ